MLRAVAVDLDGTLLRSDQTVSGRTAAALAAVVRAGLRVVIVTARPPRTVDILAAAAGLTGSAVCSNGAILYDIDSQALDIVGPLPLDVAERAARTIAEVMPGAAFAIETGRRVLRDEAYRHMATLESAREVVADLWLTSEECVKLLAWSPAPVTGDMLARLRDAVPEVVVHYSGGPGLIEISAAGVTKVSGLERLCGPWGIAADEVIAFGDMPNDLDVLRWAGTGVAVANAHPDVLAEMRARGGRITGANDDDGVAMVLEEILVVPQP